MKTLKLCDCKDDRISDLPESVILHILSFLDLKQVIQTSILSIRWRYLWKSLFSFNFNCNSFDSHKDGKAKAFKEFVDQVLLFLHSSSNIQRFILSCYGLNNYYDISSRIHKWILTALSGNLLELDLNISVPDLEFWLPDCIFTCKSLVKLELKLALDSTYCLILSLPDSMSLPCLKTLVLYRVSFNSSDAPNKIFSSCPVLESLTVIWSEFSQRNVDITAPKLKYLVIENLYCRRVDLEVYNIKLYAPNLISFICKDYMLNDYSIKNLPALVKAEIGLNFEQQSNRVIILDDELKRSIALRGKIFLRALQNVEDLTLPCLFVEFGVARAVPLSTPIQFRNLRCLKLRTLLRRNSILNIIHLLQLSPNIESLILDEVKDSRKELDPALYKYWNELELIQQQKIALIWKLEPRSQDMLNHLKFVEIRGVEGRVNELIILSHFLKHAVVLQKITLFSSMENLPHSESDHLNKFNQELQTMPRASSNVNFLFCENLVGNLIHF